MHKSDLNLDRAIEQLLQTTGKQVQLPENQIRQLCQMSREKFLEEPMLLELEAPVNIVGDIHGQFGDLLRHFEALGYPPESNYLFLGDYVDRGKQSLETICLMLAYKLKYPSNFFLLRGNHECASINRIYGFYDECKRRYNIKLWKTFTDCFNCLPIENIPSVMGKVSEVSVSFDLKALLKLCGDCSSIIYTALVEGTILCMHGGLSPDLSTVDQLRHIIRPIDIPDHGLVCDLLWADPDDDITGWGENDRGVSYTFGGDVVRHFLKRNDLSLIVRAHQVVEDGYQFFQKRNLVTLFSAPNYCGEFDNAAGVMIVTEDLTCSFSILPPETKKEIASKKK